MRRTLLWWAIVVLLLAPLLALAGVGVWLLWREGLLTPLWWGVLVGWGVACLLLSFYGLLHRPRLKPELHWTEQDKAAVQLIQLHADQAEQILQENPEQLLRAEFYTEAAKKLGLALAQHYRPGSEEPFDHLTVVEVLAVAELALSDLARMIEPTVMGCSWLTVGQLRGLDGLGKSVKYMRQGATTASEGYTLISAFLNPFQAAVGGSLSRLGLAPLLQLSRNQLLAHFYGRYLHLVGSYLIEANSGRLRAGGAAYLQTIRKSRTQEASNTQAEQTPQPGEDALTIVLVGQAKAGKSSVLNALLGRHQAAVDHLPTIGNVVQYRLEVEVFGEAVDLVDTPGYGSEGVQSDSFHCMLKAVERAGMILLVVRANESARQPDQHLLSQLKAWYDQRPQLKQPPIVAVLTHVDLLRLVLEWTRQYDGWLDEESGGAKERSIRQAVKHIQEVFGDQVASVIPVCSDSREERLWGVEEWLVPAIHHLLPQSRSKWLLDRLHMEIVEKNQAGILQRLMATKDLVQQLSANPDKEPKERNKPKGIQ